MATSRCSRCTRQSGLLGAVLAICLLVCAGDLDGYGPHNDPTGPARVETNAHGYLLDDAATGQALTLLHYAYAHYHATGAYPASVADIATLPLPLPTWTSPHTGDRIFPDDDSIDFDGDMLYQLADGQPLVGVQLTRGILTLPGELELAGATGRLTADDPFMEGARWYLRWPDELTRGVLSELLFAGIEAHEALYGRRPASFAAWLASGLAPLSAGYGSQLPGLTLREVYSGSGDAHYLRKVKLSYQPPE